MSIIVYYVLISALAVFMTIKDKRAAQRGGRRISENALILTALLGGAAPMLVTMKIIRHKTLHKKFMIGLPLIIFLHILFIISAIWYMKNYYYGTMLIDM